MPRTVADLRPTAVIDLRAGQQQSSPSQLPAQVWRLCLGADCHGLLHVLYCCGKHTHCMPVQPVAMQCQMSCPGQTMHHKPLAAFEHMHVTIGWHCVVSSA